MVQTDTRTQGHEDRRGSTRIRLTRACPYEFSSIHGENIEWFHGDALTVNISLGGMLLVMTDAPRLRQVLQVHGPSAAGPDVAIQVVEVCWTRELPIGGDGKMYLVGVRFMFQVPFSDR